MLIFEYSIPPKTHTAKRKQCVYVDHIRLWHDIYKDFFWNPIAVYSKDIVRHECTVVVFAAMLCVFFLYPILSVPFLNDYLYWIVIVAHARIVFDVRLTLYETDIFLCVYDGIATWW